jgi:proprotein convertase subtilisin/kexin type 5
MNKIIEVILYSILLIACSSQNCNAGYYDDGNGYCPQCSYKCSTCNTNADNCDSCNGNYRDSIPSCSCIVKYYDNGTPDCQPCQYSCSTCSSLASCISCNSALNRLLESGNPYCACTTRYYDPGS